MQAFEWSKLIAEGVRPWGNPWGAAQFGSSFFMITGFHGTHVTFGVIFLLIVARKSGAAISKRSGAASSPAARGATNRRDNRPLLALRRPGLGLHLRILLSLVREGIVAHAKYIRHNLRPPIRSTSSTRSSSTYWSGGCSSSSALFHTSSITSACRAISAGR